MLTARLNQKNNNNENQKYKMSDSFWGFASHQKSNSSWLASKSQSPESTSPWSTKEKRLPESHKDKLTVTNILWHVLSKMQMSFQWHMCSVVSTKKAFELYILFKSAFCEHDSFSVVLEVARTSMQTPLTGGWFCSEYQVRSLMEEQQCVLDSGVSDVLCGFGIHVDIKKKPSIMTWHECIWVVPCKVWNKENVLIMTTCGPLVKVYCFVSQTTHQHRYARLCAIGWMCLDDVSSWY